MGHAVHQVLVNGSADAVILPFCHRLCRPFIAVYRHCTADCTVNQFFRLVDAVRYRNHDHRLSVKTGHLHIFVRRHNDGLGSRNLFLGQHILSSAGTVGLGFQGNPQFFSCILQIFSRHIGVSNSRRTSGNCQNPVTARIHSRRFRNRSRRFLFLKIFFLLFLSKAV